MNIDIQVIKKNLDKIRINHKIGSAPEHILFLKYMFDIELGNLKKKKLKFLYEIQNINININKNIFVYKRTHKITVDRSKNLMNLMKI